jgi:hypothetical protein
MKVEITLNKDKTKEAITIICSRELTHEEILQLCNSLHNMEDLN